MHPTDEEEDSGEESIVPRGPDGWMSIYEDQDPALVRIVIKEAWSAILPILTSLESHHLFGYVHLR